MLFAGERTSNGGEVALAEESLGTNGVDVELSRTDGLFLLRVSDPTATGGFRTVFSRQAAAELAVSGRAYLAAARRNEGVPVVATFRRVSIETANDVADLECGETLAVEPGGTLTLRGAELHTIRSVDFGGQPTTFRQVAWDRLEIDVPTGIPSGPATVHATSRGRRVVLRDAVVVGAEWVDARLGPDATALVDAAGGRVVSMAAGDDVFLLGERLPTGSGTLAWFGDSPARVLPDSTSTRLHLELEAVKRDGVACPRLFVPNARSPRGSVLYGDAFGIDASAHPRLCPSLIGAPSDAPPASTRVAMASVPPSLIGTSTPLRVRALWSERRNGSTTRGSRLVETLVRPDGGHGAERWFESVRARMNEAVQGEEDEAPCGCDVTAAASPSDGTLGFAPCSMSPGPLPPVPDHPNAFVPNVPPFSIVDIAAAAGVPSAPIDCAGVSPDDPRPFAWCQLRAVVQAIPSGPLAGYPTFESYPSLESVYQAHAAPNLEELGVVMPWDRLPDEKSTMLEPGMAERFVDLGYAHPDDLGTRVATCTADERNWMPRFRTGDRLVKLFWVTGAELGDAIDPSLLYSYQPPSGPRVYLVGLHIGVARFFEPGEYLRWLTFWVPPTGPTTGAFNDACPPGTKADMPADFLGTGWDQFVLCTEDEGHDCGNPWGPTNECAAGSAAGCESCHRDQGEVRSGLDGQFLAPAWLGRLALFHASDVVESYQAIRDGDRDARPIDCALGSQQLTENPLDP